MLAVDRTVYFIVTSRDVVHLFAVPEMGVKQNAFAGEEDVVMTETTEQGTFQGYCMEFCGVNHAGMTFEVEVLSQSEYRGWLGEHEQRPGDESGTESEA